MLLRPWLELHLEMGDIPGLEWVDKSSSIFRILWKHRSKGNWTSLHGAVFVVRSSGVDFHHHDSFFTLKEWARNTGRFMDNMLALPNYAHLKTRLRCAINKAPDIEEVESMTNMRAFEPYKVYKFLPKPRKILQLFTPLAQFIIPLFFSAPRVSFHQPWKRRSKAGPSASHWDSSLVSLLHFNHLFLLNTLHPSLNMHCLFNIIL
jgi:hypothetical protein